MDDLHADAPSTEQLCQWASKQAAETALVELNKFVNGALPTPRPVLCKWFALAFRRDVRALLASTPAFGITHVPDDLRAFREFDQGLRSLLQNLDARLVRTAHGIPLNSILGPWEGGIQATEHSPKEHLRTMIPLFFVAYNINSALGVRSAIESHDEGILHVIALLHDRGAAIAVISEPRLGVGMVWPDWTGYSFLGERTGEPGSVAVIILQGLTFRVVQIEGIPCGSKFVSLTRAIMGYWLWLFMDLPPATHRPPDKSSGH